MKMTENVSNYNWSRLIKIFLKDKNEEPSKETQYFRLYTAINEAIKAHKQGRHKKAYRLMHKAKKMNIEF